MKRASDYGFSVQASGEENSRALQRAVLGGGTILVDEPGDYRMRETTTRRCFSARACAYCARNTRAAATCW